MTLSTALKKLADAVRVRHFSLQTERRTGYGSSRNMAAVRKYPPGMTSEKKVERSLTEEARRGVAASTQQNQALNALVFFMGRCWGCHWGRWRRCG